MYLIAVSRSFFTVYTYMSSLGSGHHYRSQLYQYTSSKIIIAREGKVILKNSFIKFKVIFMMFQMHL